jgi:nucleotide-binding universal stress UspA family protein
MTEFQDGVVVGIDGSAATRHAVAEGAELAAFLGVTLHLVCAYRQASRSERKRFSRKLPDGISLDYMDEREAAARDILAEARASVSYGVRTRMHPEKGELRGALQRVAERECARPFIVAA